MASSQKNCLAFDEYLESAECKVIEKASRMIFEYVRDLNNPPKNRNWKQEYKDDFFRLIIQCGEHEIYPIPEEVIEVSRQLLGQTKGNVQPIEKYYVQSCLAQEYDPEILNDPDGQIGIISFAARALDEAGGLRENKISTASGQNDYRQTVREWLSEEDFLRGWKIKRERHKEFSSRPDRDEMLELVQEILNKN